MVSLEEKGKVSSPKFTSISSMCEALSIEPSLAKRLQELGFDTLESLATATFEELGSIGFDRNLAGRILFEARKALSFRPLSGDELLIQGLRVQRITTGSRALDDVLGGGVETQAITELFGEYGAGKSQLCHQLCVNVQLSYDRRGLNGTALYVDTENTFRPERICQMAEHLKLDPMEVLKGILCVRAVSSDHQVLLVERCEEVLRNSRARLLVVDSLTTHFRSEYPGRELLARRQLNLTKHLHRLARLGKAFNLAVVVTNHIMSSPDEPFGQSVKAAGGLTLAYASRTRLYLRKSVSPSLRIARLVSSPYLPEREALFKIAEKGVEDVREGEA